MKVQMDAKPASERPGKPDYGVLSVFRGPKAGSDAERLSGMQRSVARLKMGLSVPGSVQSRISTVRRTA